MKERRAFINAVAGAVPGHDVHHHFIDWAEQQIDDPRTRRLFRRMADRSGVEHRWSVLPPAPGGGSPVGAGGFYAQESPPTSKRMIHYAEAAPKLALEAIAKLGGVISLAGVTHLIVASCTGFVAPGIDQVIAKALGLADVERTLVGFMGCYAAVSALRLGRHIVRSEPAAKALVVTVELSSLHLQPARDLDRLLAMLQFGDGAGAAMLTSEPRGLEIKRPFAISLSETAELIQWRIGDTGFEMHLSGEVPTRIGAALRQRAVRSILYDGWSPEEVDSWAVHAGGRSILDAVERGLDLTGGKLSASRDILARCGNMSSSTLMFVLAALDRRETRMGIALAFGPGLAAEGFRFERIP